MRSCTLCCQSTSKGYLLDKKMSNNPALPPPFCGSIRTFPFLLPTVLFCSALLCHSIQDAVETPRANISLRIPRAVPS